MNNDKKLTIFLFKILPKGLLSRLFGYITRIPVPWRALSPIINWYKKKYGVRDEYITPDNGFRNFNEFFTRGIREGVHVIDRSKGSIISPVDARVDMFGKIEGSTILQAKGVDYSLYDLVPSNSAKKYFNGNYVTLYLSPGDYHRIHSPVSGKITGYFVIPGKLYTVQEFMVRGLTGLFSINERIITYIDTVKGSAAVCKIGAMNVGRMSLSYEDIFTNGFFKKKKEVLYPGDCYKTIGKGDELGVFNLGSTVVLLFEKGMMEFENITPSMKIRVGDKLGSFKD